MTPLVFVPVGVLAFGVLLAAGKSAADYLRPSGAHRKLPAARSAGTGAAPAKTPRPAGAAPLVRPFKGTLSGRKLARLKRRFLKAQRPRRWQRLRWRLRALALDVRWYYPAAARRRLKAARRRLRRTFAGWDVMQLISPHPERELPRNGALLGDLAHLTVPVRPTADAPPWAVVTGEMAAVPDMLPAPETAGAE